MNYNGYAIKRVRLILRCVLDYPSKSDRYVMIMRKQRDSNVYTME